MKRLICLAALLLILLGTVQAATPAHVVDMAGTFTAQEVSALEDKLAQIYDKYRFDLNIVTTRNSQGKSAARFSEDYYITYKPMAEYPNGALFSFNFDLGEYDEASRGLGRTIFETAGPDELYNVLKPYLPSKNYFGAMQAYANYVERRLNRYSTVNADGSFTLTATERKPTLMEAASEVARQYLIIIAGVGLAIGVGVAFLLKGKLQIAKPQYDATRYTSANSLKLRDSSDLFLYQTVTRTRIQENKSSGGGGGARFGGGGGGSHGHRGGKL
ncbi:MAG: TPM domain-containing protein [Clostridiales bacterium]|nr:TPM domain-containing protein [Clostridiales bacterium]